MKEECNQATCSLFWKQLGRRSSSPPWIFPISILLFLPQTEIWNLTNTSLNSNTNSSIASVQSPTSFSFNLQQLSQGTHPRLRLNLDSEILHRPLRIAVKQMWHHPNEDRRFNWKDAGLSEATESYHYKKTLQENSTLTRKINE